MNGRGPHTCGGQDSSGRNLCHAPILGDPPTLAGGVSPRSIRPGCLGHQLDFLGQLQGDRLGGHGEPHKVCIDHGHVGRNRLNSLQGGCDCGLSQSQSGDRSLLVQAIADLNKRPLRAVPLHHVGQLHGRAVGKDAGRPQAGLVPHGKDHVLGGHKNAQKLTREAEASVVSTVLATATAITGSHQ